jgi:hypothetical protein
VPPPGKNHRSRETARNAISNPKTVNKIVPLFLSLSACCLLVSCDMATPETHFEVAVLSCNVMHGFAGRGLERRLESPSTMLSKNGEEVPVKRAETIGYEIQNLEGYFAKLKRFKQTDDNRDMLQRFPRPL